MQTFPSHHDPKQEISSDRVLLTEGYWRHGRFYGSWRRDLYLFPIDQEEMRRLDIFHKFFLLARKGFPFSYPIHHSLPASILDLGTGTGIWAIYVAEEILPAAHVTAVDLNRVQPPQIPPNMATVQMNIEDSSWAPLPTDFDFVHMRLLLGSIQGSLWEAVYRNAFKHTARKRGIIEQNGLSYSFKGWMAFNAAISSSTKPSFDVVSALEAMSLAPLVEKLGMDVSQVKDLCARLRSEICTLRYHAYLNMHVWTARKP
ncbi:uncharacterized protein LMH87_007613 [Akanthomyces muscarius]|uniref:Methyltransferase LaeA n=1 Tax=Akanthomyces muscarius TaxID=2231603 RepID=A0A9W8QJH0_AKAMU|nr:uncharacterized protein LMH87_007613 [Akanthomyces muscarius]KAJ4161582.1 hypothetical protein LMH87_007613 [Akanthomyces muscarius]